MSTGKNVRAEEKLYVLVEEAGKVPVRIRGKKKLSFGEAWTRSLDHFLETGRHLLIREL